MATSPTQAIVSNYQKAEFLGGNDAFEKKFMNIVHAYLDMALYAIQGKVTLIFNIDPTGKSCNIDVVPKFKNSEMFINDSNRFQVCNESDFR